jgi:recombination protein U
MSKKAKGMALEKAINNTNLEYRKLGKAIIVKFPTPFLITSKGLIPQQAICDYIGCYKVGSLAVPINFDAKECGSTTSFPFANIKDHQLLYLTLCHNIGAKSSILVHFTKLNLYYMIPTFEINKILETGRKSIKISEMKSEWQIKNIGDYLNILCEII